MPTAAMATKRSSRSIPMLRYPRKVAAAIVEPPPMNGSSKVPRPSGRDARTSWRRNAWGLSDGCGSTPSRSVSSGGQDDVREGLRIRDTS
jgi:hypothetical protein